MPSALINITSLAVEVEIENVDEVDDVCWSSDTGVIVVVDEVVLEVVDEVVEDVVLDEATVVLDVVDEVEDVVAVVGLDVYGVPLSEALPTMLPYIVCGRPTYCGV